MKVKAEKVGQILEFWKLVLFGKHASNFSGKAIISVSANRLRLLLDTYEVESNCSSQPSSIEKSKK